MMPCPFCEGATKVYDSRPQDGNIIWRRRRCNGCGIAFSTYESVEVNVQIISDDLLAEVQKSLRKGVAHYIIEQLTGVSLLTINQIAANMEKTPVAARD